METKNIDSFYETIHHQIDMNEAEYVTPRRNSVLALWWKKESNMQILYKDFTFIDSRVSIREVGDRLFMTWIYGDLISTDKQITGIDFDK